VTAMEPWEHSEVYSAIEERGRIDMRSRNAYIHDVGDTIFNTVKNLVKKTIRANRIEEGGM
jgi:hypothetical protein